MAEDQRSKISEGTHCWAKNSYNGKNCKNQRETKRKPKDKTNKNNKNQPTAKCRQVPKALPLPVRTRNACADDDDPDLGRKKRWRRSCVEITLKSLPSSCAARDLQTWSVTFPLSNQCMMGRMIYKDVQVYKKSCSGSGCA